MKNKYTSISSGANKNYSATEKSLQFLNTSGSNLIISFVNKIKITGKNVFGTCKGIINNFYSCFKNQYKFQCYRLITNAGVTLSRN